MYTISAHITEEKLFKCSMLFLLLQVPNLTCLSTAHMYIWERTNTEYTQSISTLYFLKGK